MGVFFIIYDFGIFGIFGIMNYLSISLEIERWNVK